MRQRPVRLFFILLIAFYPYLVPRARYSMIRACGIQSSARLNRPPHQTVAPAIFLFSTRSDAWLRALVSRPYSFVCFGQ